MSTAFNDTERRILRIVQADIPDSMTPYADIAKEAGTDEQTVLELLTRLRKEGAIRRFGASIRHQRTGWKHNAMVAWIVSEDQMDTCGEIASRHPQISHCYFRPSAVQDWPYTFYTMIHGRSEEECLAVVEELRRTSPLDEHAVLKSLQELKKSSMTYFV